MLYSCGLRISEALNLKVEDVDLQTGVLTIIDGKFNKDR
jgi:integrase/recombinase XerD